MSLLTLPFRTRGHDGRIVIRVRPNDDRTRPDMIASPRTSTLLRSRAIPILTAEVDFAGEGPAGWFDWVQLIRHVRRGEVIDEEIDAGPRLAPLYVVGYRPTFADAPANPIIATSTGELAEDQGTG